jgi:non-ribosomal peptide synthetase component F
LPELFAAQVARSPDGVAVIFEQEQLSYGELDRRANALAHYLRARGVGPETVVGLCLARSPEMIVGLLAILKAGGAYLPLDPDYPPERLAFMLGDAGARVLITHGTTHGALMQRLCAPATDTGPSIVPSMAPGSVPSIVRLDSDAHAIAAMPETAPAVALDPQHPAYVIYTSGSTGTPKGVVMAHGPLANLVSWSADAIGSGSDTAVAQFTPISFDVSAQEILSALIGSKILFLLRNDIRRDPADFLRWLLGHKIN